MTQHTTRVLLAIPASAVSATRTWVSANLDAAGGANWFTLPLSATGLDPATHYAASFHCTVPQLKSLIGRLLTLVTGVADPRGQWDSWTRQQRRDWWNSVRTALRDQKSIYCQLAWNDLGEDNDADTEFAIGNLKRVNNATV